MVNEAVIRDRLADPIDFTVADNTGIEKGAVLALSDPRTAALATAGTDRVAGIAAREKIADDGRTRLSVYRKGIFDMIASGTINVGDSVCCAVDNYVVATAATEVASEVLGIALEAGSDEEVIQIELNIGANPVAYS